MKTFVYWLCILSAISPPARAETSSSLLDLEDSHFTPSTSEFVYRPTARENLVPIQVMGAVGKPGLYFVPPNTHLLKLLTLAGGPQGTAKNEEIMIHKAEPTWDRLKMGGLTKSGSAYKVDLVDLMKKADHTNLSMAAGDVVFVPTKEPFISPDLMRTLTIASLLATTVLTVILIHQDTRTHR